MSRNRHRRPPRRKGRKLSTEQMAIAELLILGISEYSESVYCAGWRADIEHELWDRMYPPTEDSYDRAFKRMVQLARKSKKPLEQYEMRGELCLGLRLIVEQSRVWAYWDEKKYETAIHICDWQPMHLAWQAKQKEAFSFGAGMEKSSQ